MNLWKITVFLFFVAQCLATSEEDDLSKIKCGDMTSLDSEKNENEENDENSAPPNTNDNVQYKENELTENIIAEIPVVSDTDENDSNNSSQNVSDKTPIDEHLIEDNIIENESSSTEYQLKSSSTENQQEYLEENYSRAAVEAINDMPTLEETEVKFNEMDIRLLPKYCDTDEDCLDKKKESVIKYHQKMQAIQCIHGLLVFKVLDELKTIVFDDNVPDDSSEKIVKKNVTILEKNRIYLTSMLALLNMTNWEAYPWQIEMFTFVEGLLAPDANFNNYKTYFAEHQQSKRDNVLQFVRKCIQYKYLNYKRYPLSKNVTIAFFVAGVYLQMLPYLKSPLIANYIQLGKHKVENLILRHLYARHEFIFDWSMFKAIKLEKSNVEHKLLKYVAIYSQQQLTHEWELDPIGGNKYNDLIAKCIHLRLVYHVWYHLHIYHTLNSRSMSEDTLELWLNRPLRFRKWYALVDTLKTVLREFQFKENNYWSGIRIMINDFKRTSKEELAARVEYTRKYFCQAVEDLEFASASDINQQLMNIKVPEGYGEMYDEIEANAESLKAYAKTLSAALEPVDGTIVRLIVSAEENETFVLR